MHIYRVKSNRTHIMPEITHVIVIWSIYILLLSMENKIPMIHSFACWKLWNTYYFLCASVCSSGLSKLFESLQPTSFILLASGMLPFYVKTYFPLDTCVLEQSAFSHCNLLNGKSGWDISFRTYEGSCNFNQDNNVARNPGGQTQHFKMTVNFFKWQIILRKNIIIVKNHLNL